MGNIPMVCVCVLFSRLGMNPNHCIGVQCIVQDKLIWGESKSLRLTTKNYSYFCGENETFVKISDMVMINYNA